MWFCHSMERNSTYDTAQTDWSHPESVRVFAWSAQEFVLLWKTGTSLVTTNSAFNFCLLSLSFPKIYQKQHQKLCRKQQQNILTWPNRAFKPWAQLFFHRPHWHTSRSPITHNVRALSTFPFNPMRFSLLVSQTCACPPRWQSRS